MTLRLILGDQLNSTHSWFESVDENTIYLMAEMQQETNYVKHHIQKVGTDAQSDDLKEKKQNYLF
jgi:deoxyribodipyrimidine photolyase-related protein